MRKIVIILVVLIFSLPYSTVYAVGENGFSSNGDSLISKDLDFCVQETCSGHPSFINYLVRTDGLFAVYYRTAENTNAINGVFSRVYIDIFNTDGDFLAEISFHSRDDITLSFYSNALEIYLSDSMLSVELSTYEVTQKQIPRYYATENGLQETFRKEIQTADGWIYTCNGSSMNYTSIVRKNDQTEELLLSLSGNIPGTDQTILSFAGPTIAGCLILIIPYIVWKLKHTGRKKE